MTSNTVNNRLFALICRGERIYYCALRLLLGGTLVFSSTAKLPMHSEFVNLVNGYHLLPVWMATIYATALPWVELLVGAYLILGIQVRPIAVIAGLISTSFMVANVSAIMAGAETCLHCFGQVIDLSPLNALIIDVVMAGVASYLVIVGSRAKTLSFDGWFAGRQRPKAAARA
jgi:putative oxidoreductase